MGKGKTSLLTIGATVFKCFLVMVLSSPNGTYGSGGGQFKFPSGIMVNDEGHLIVADRGNNRLQVFTSEKQTE